MAKEAIFSSLESIVDMEGLKVTDLFAGTGNIGLEFLSRGAAHVISVDKDDRNIRYMKDIREENHVPDWDIIKTDVLSFIKKGLPAADIIFADPPYDMPQVHDMVNMILSAPQFQSGDCLLVLEHVDRLVFNQKEVFLKKQYGNTCFTCFRANAQIL